jgi:hypothetical protein
MQRLGKKNSSHVLGAVAQACDPSCSGGRDQKIMFRGQLGKKVARPHLKQ